jgi:hypothetical protein
VSKEFLKKIDPAIFKERDEMTEQLQKLMCFAYFSTLSLRKGISGIRSIVKKKRRLFSVPIQLCRSLVALPHNLPPSNAVLEY